MLHQEINNEGRMSIVAHEMVDDLKKELEVFSSYEVLLDECKDQINIKVRDNGNGMCWIMTGTVTTNIIKVVDFYMMQYSNINYHLDAEIKMDDTNRVKALPVFVICVSMKAE